MDRLAQNSCKIKTHEIAMIQGKLSEILAMLETDLDQEQRIDLVERDLFSGLLGMRGELLKLYVEKSGDGDCGQSIESAEEGFEI